MATKLRSISLAKTLDLLSEGEIEGLVNGHKSIFFDNTQLQSPDSFYNFNGIVVDERNGTDTQTYVEGFSDVESQISWAPREVDVNWVQYTTGDLDTDALRITIRCPALYRQTDDGTKNNKVEFEIQVSNNQTNWTTVKEREIEGRSMGPYDQSYRFEKPSGTTGIWYLRIRRTDGGPSDSSKQSNELWFQAVVEIQDIKLAYENSAYIGLGFDAESTNGIIPTREFDIRGIKVQVPSNWVSPVLDSEGELTAWGFYNGVWDGTFKAEREWTYDPAWVLYDIITNDRYGLGGFISDLSVDKFSFYNASAYNMQLLDDGVATSTKPGGLEPRFSYNGIVQQRTDAMKVLQAIAATCRSSVVIGNNQLALLQDRPTETTQLITNSDVIGEFEYIFSDKKALITSLDLTFNDEYDGNRASTININDFAQESGLWVSGGTGQTAIDRFGYNKTSKALPGVVSEGQAIREGRWFLDTTLNGSKNVQFAVGWKNMLIQLGDVVAVSDTFFTEETFGGFVASGSTDTVINLAVPIDLVTGPHTITIGTETRTVSTTGTNLTSVTVTSAFSNAPIAYESFIVIGPNASGDAISPQLFKVVSLDETAPGQYKVLANHYDPDKYARVEQGIVVPPPLYGPIGGRDIAAPTIARLFQENKYIDKTTGLVIPAVTIGWEEVVDEFLLGYQVIWRGPEGIWNNTGVFGGLDLTVENAIIGEAYEFFVLAVNTLGVESQRSYGVFSATDWDLGSTTLVPVEDIRPLGTSAGTTEFNTTDLIIEWNDPNPDYDVPGSGNQVKDYKVVFYNNTPKDTVIKELYTTQLSATLFNTEQVSLLGKAYRFITVEVYVRDTNNVLTSGTTQVLNNPAPLLPNNPVLSNGVGEYRLSHDVPVDSDAIGILIWHVVDDTTNSDFTVDASNLQLDDVGTVHTVPAAELETYNIKWALYDDYSKSSDELIISGSQSTTTLSPTETDVVEFSYEGLIIKAEQDVNGDPTNKIEWSACTAIRTVNAASGSGSTSTKAIPAGSFDWTAGIVYIYLDWDGQVINGTTNINDAIGANGDNIIGTYRGGLDYTVGGGDAFTDGGFIYGQTIGAEQLVVDSAVITGTAQIGNAIITTAKISESIESGDWNSTTGTGGWKIGGIERADGTGAGLIQSDNIIIKSATGEVVLAAGAEAVALANNTENVGDRTSGDLNDLVDDIADDVVAKSAAFYQTGEPTATAIGDIWVDTDDGNKMYSWSGSEWVMTQDFATSVSTINQIDSSNASVYIADAAISSVYLAIQEEESGKTITTFDPLSDKPFTITDNTAERNILFDISVIDGQASALVNGTGGRDFINSTESITTEVKRSINPYYLGDGAEANAGTGTAFSGSEFDFDIVDNSGTVTLAWRVTGREFVDTFDPDYAVTPQWQVEVFAGSVAGTRIVNRTYTGSGWAYQEPAPDDHLGDSGCKIDLIGSFIHEGATPATQEYTLRVTKLDLNTKMTSLSMREFSGSSAGFNVNAGTMGDKGYHRDKDTGLMMQWGSATVNGNSSLPITFSTDFLTAFSSGVITGTSTATNAADNMYINSPTVSGMNITNGTDTQKIYYIVYGY